MGIARDQTWWSNWIREDVQQVHSCADNPHDDVGVLFHVGQEGGSNWFICHTWIATEENVRSGKAPEAGEILSAMELRATFCPFCGIKLPAGG
jgi:hypothetical protein